jgi:hypothetical protein
MEDAPSQAIAAGALARLRRRAVTVPTIVLGFGVTTAVLPLLVGLGLAVDLVGRRRHLTTLRLAGFLWVFLGVEVLGLCCLLGVGLFTIGRRARRAALTWPVQRRYTGLLLLGLRALFRVRFVVEG